MKNSKICPKCNGDEFARIEGTMPGYGSGNNIPIGLLKYANIARYICLKCGFTEEWVDEKYLGKIKETHGTV